MFVTWSLWFYFYFSCDLITCPLFLSPLVFKQETRWLQSYTCLLSLSRMSLQLSIFLLLVYLLPCFPSHLSWILKNSSFQSRVTCISRLVWIFAFQCPFLKVSHVTQVTFYCSKKESEKAKILVWLTFNYYLLFNAVFWQLVSQTWPQIQTLKNIAKILHLRVFRLFTFSLSISSKWCPSYSYTEWVPHSIPSIIIYYLLQVVWFPVCLVFLPHFLFVSL